MRARQSVLVVLLLLMQPVLAGAQTEPSPRIRSLSTTFSGILDDFLTDVYLNPARVAELDRPMAYAVTLPRRSIEAPYPLASASLYGSGWVESEFMRYDFEPVGLSYFGTIGGGMAFSIGTEIDVAGDETLDETNDIDTYGDEIRIQENSYGRAADIQHYLLDLTLAPAGRDNPFGARLLAAYDAADIGRADYWRVGEWDLSIPDRVNRRYDANYMQNEYERVSLGLALGLYRPGNLVRELVVRGGVARHTLKSDSRDARGERWETDQILLSSSYDNNSYKSDREYDGYDVGARAHFGWSERVRSTHALTWSRSNGDGMGGSFFDSEDHGSTSITSNLAALYAYNGTTDAVRFESTIGYFNNLFDNVLFAFALFGVYSSSTLDEDAAGDAALRLYDSGLGVDSTFTSPYRQNHKRSLDNLRLSVPMAVEWAFHKYARVRIGVTVTASRVEDDRVSKRDAVELTEEIDILGIAFDSRDLNRDSGVDAVFTNGLEININDRFVVDLLTEYTYEINLFRYGYASIRYRF